MFRSIEKTKQKKNVTLKAIIAFILGFLSANNVIYLFVVGNTPILIVYVFSVISLLLIALLNKGGGMRDVFLYFSKSFALFLLFAFFSVISVLLFGLDNISQWFVGQILLALNLSVIILVIVLKDYRSFLLSGIVFGVIANAIVSIYAYVLYSSGTVWVFAWNFPQMPSVRPYLGNAYKAVGMFREQGHLMRYLAVAFFMVLSYLVQLKRPVKYLVFIVFFALMAFTGSSSLVIFGVALVLYQLFKSGSDINEFIKTLSTSIFAILLLIVLSNYLPAISKIFVYLKNTMSDTLELDGSNGTRLSGMQYAFALIKNYPVLGTGWNTITKMFYRHGYIEDSIHGSYSAMLSMFVEIGVFALFFVYFILKSFFVLLKKKDKESFSVAFALLTYFIIFCSTDLAFDAVSCILIGLAMILTKEGNNDFNKNTI